MGFQHRSWPHGMQPCTDALDHLTMLPLTSKKLRFMHFVDIGKVAIEIEKGGFKKSKYQPWF